MGKIDNTQIIGKVLLQFEKLDSTNAYAQYLLSKSKPVEGTVITAEYQERGRGQIGSVWHSHPGKNVILSVIVYPEFLTVDRQFQLVKWVSVALWETVDQFFPGQVSIKWPNDILLRSKKIAGILIQNMVQGSRMQATVIGIGMNINQIAFDPGIGSPISFQSAAGTVFNRSEIMHLLLKILDRTFLELKKDPGFFDKSYLNHLFRKDEIHIFKTPSGAFFSGRITGVNKMGQLAILTKSQEMRYFSLKEIQFL